MQGLKEVSQVIQLEKNQCLHDFEDSQTDIFLMVQGSAELMLQAEDKTYSGPSISAGELFGGLALVRDNRTKIKVTARESVICLKTSVKRLNENAGTKVGAALFKDVINHVKKFNEMIESVEDPSDKASEYGFFMDTDYIKDKAKEEDAAFLMSKKFTCPVCKTVSESLTVRDTKVKMIGQGEFFMGLYEPIEPLWYNLVTCDGCGFTEQMSQFSEPIKYDIEKIREACSNIKEAFQVSYSDCRTLEEVLNGYRMWRLTMEKREMSPRTTARCDLAIYEVLTRAGYAEAAEVYRDQAFDIYKGMFASGILDVNDQQLQQLYLILGKLHEKRGEYQDAKNAYRQSKAIKTDDTKFVELAENYLIDLDDMM